MTKCGRPSTFSPATTATLCGRHIARIGEALDRARESMQRKRAALRLEPGQAPAMTPAVRHLKARWMARSLP